MSTQSAFRRAGAGAAVVALALAGVALTAAPAHAATFTVTNTASSGAGSFAQAITDANTAAGPDVIEFALPDPTVIDLTIDLPDVTGVVSIEGPGSAALTVDAVTNALVFQASAAGSSVTGITLSTDDVVGADGITANGGSLTVTDVIADGFPDYGLVSVNSVIVATDSSFSDNGTNGVFLNATVPGIALTLDNVDVNNNVFGVAVAATAPTGVLTFENVEAYLNDIDGIRVDSPSSEIDVLHSTLRENGVGAAFDLDGGDIDIINTDAFGNLLQGYEFALEQTSLFFNGSDTYENGLGSPVNGGAVQATLEDSTFTVYGSTFNDNEADHGGGIYIGVMTGASELLFDTADISGNTVSGQGGGVYLGQLNGSLGAIHGIQFLGSRISGNTSDGDGGGIFVDTIGSGVPYEVSFQINDTTIDDNLTLSGDGGGIAIDELTHDINANSVLRVNSSTISNNRAPGGSGGGVYLNKPGASTSTTFLNFTNSTLSGNSADVAGALYLDGPGTSEELELTIQNSTVVSNSSGVVVAGVDDGLILRNSIVARNGTVDLDHDDTPTLFTADFSNIQRPVAGILDEIAAGDGNQVGIDPQLGTLADNGGLTLTHLPQPGSPVFDAGDPAFGGIPNLDQRGEARVIVRLDMGSVESPFLLPATGAITSTIVPFGAFALLLVGAGLFWADRRRIALRA
jgi:LPXTG-motif cell wall-anchored protein